MLGALLGILRIGHAPDYAVAKNLFVLSQIQL